MMRRERRLNSRRNINMMDRLIEQNRLLDQNALMTDISDPDDASEVPSTDSLFDPTSICHYSSSSDDSSVLSDDSTVSTCSSTSTDDIHNLGPPPPGSIMEYWDKPISACSFYEFPDCFINKMVTTSDMNPTTDVSDEENSVSSAASLDFDPQPTPILRCISATTRVSVTGDTGELIDTGGNFCMCNDLTMLVNVFPITPFGISMAATQDKLEPTCTHRGDFPLPTARLTSIDHPQIEGAYISGLRAANFIFLVCVWSSGE